MGNNCETAASTNGRMLMFSCIVCLITSISNESFTTFYNRTLYMITGLFRNDCGFYDAKFLYNTLSKHY